MIRRGSYPSIALPVLFQARWFHKQLTNDPPVNMHIDVKNQSSIDYRSLYYRRRTIKSNPCCIVVAPASPNFNVAFGLRTWGRWTKKSNPNAEEARKRALCNIFQFGACLGFYLLGVSPWLPTFLLVNVYPRVPCFIIGCLFKSIKFYIYIFSISTVYYPSLSQFIHVYPRA
jgi:hypothetical protein